MQLVITVSQRVPVKPALQLHSAPVREHLPPFWQGFVAQTSTLASG
jgi:hypothetical protein